MARRIATYGALLLACTALLLGAAAAAKPIALATKPVAVPSAQQLGWQDLEVQLQCWA
jgi:hypothetical protein